MTRSPSTADNSPARKPVSQKRRNLVAILISFAAVSFLYFNFDPTPAGGDFAEAVDLDKVTADIAVPTEGSASTTGTTSGQSANGNQSNLLHGQTALLMNVMLLQRGIKKLESIPDYTGTFYKRERVQGALGDAQVMQIKVRHKPFGVYMKWLVGDKGRELLYAAGQYDGNILVKLGGAKGVLVPTVKLDPTGSRAMSESRYPITEIGLLNLSKTIIGYRNSDIKEKKNITCKMFDNQPLNDRKCFCFIIEYDNPGISKTYRKSIIFIDKKWSIPICVQNFGWPDGETELTGAELDKDTLIEDYRYSNLHLDQKLADAEFDRSNEKYRLRR